VLYAYVTGDSIWAAPVCAMCADLYIISTAAGRSRSTSGAGLQSHQGRVDSGRGSEAQRGRAPSAWSIPSTRLVFLKLFSTGARHHVKNVCDQWRHSMGHRGHVHPLTFTNIWARGTP